MADQTPDEAAAEWQRILDARDAAGPDPRAQETGLWHELGNVKNMATPSGLWGLGVDAADTVANMWRLGNTAAAVGVGSAMGKSKEQVADELDNGVGALFAMPHELKDGIEADPDAQEGLGKVIPGIGTLSAVTEAKLPLLHSFGASINRTAGDIPDLPQIAAGRALFSRSMDPLTTDNRFVQAYEHGELAPKIIEDLANTTMVAGAGSKAITGSVGRATAEAEAAQVAVSSAENAAKTAATNAAAKGAGQAVAEGVPAEYAANLGAKLWQESMAESLAQPAFTDLQAAAEKAAAKAGRWEGAQSALDKTAHLTGRGAMVPAKMWTAPGIIGDTAGGRFGLFAREAMPAVEQGERAGLLTNTQAGRAIPFGREGTRVGFATYLKERGLADLGQTERGAALYDWAREHVADPYRRRVVQSALGTAIHEGMQEGPTGERARVAKTAFSAQRTANTAGKLLGVDGDVVGRALTMTDAEVPHAVANALDEMAAGIDSTGGDAATVRQALIERMFPDAADQAAFELADKVRTGEVQGRPLELFEAARAKFNEARDVRQENYLTGTGESRVPTEETLRVRREEQMGPAVPMPSVVERAVRPFEGDIEAQARRIPGFESRAERARAAVPERPLWEATPREFAPYDAAQSRAARAGRQLTETERRLAAEQQRLEGYQDRAGREAVGVDDRTGMLHPGAGAEADLGGTPYVPPKSRKEARVRQDAVREHVQPAIDAEIERTWAAIEGFGDQPSLPPDWRIDKRGVPHHDVKPPHPSTFEGKDFALKKAMWDDVYREYSDEQLRPMMRGLEPGNITPESLQTARNNLHGVNAMDPNGIDAPQAALEWMKLQMKAKELASHGKGHAYAAPISDELAQSLAEQTGLRPDVIQRAFAGKSAEKVSAFIEAERAAHNALPPEVEDRLVRSARDFDTSEGRPPWQQTRSEFVDNMRQANAAADAGAFDDINRLDPFAALELTPEQVHARWRQYASETGRPVLDEVEVRGTPNDVTADRAAADIFETAFEEWKFDQEQLAANPNLPRDQLSINIPGSMTPAMKSAYRKLQREADIRGIEATIAEAGQQILDRRDALAEKYGQRGERAGVSRGRLETRAKTAESDLAREQKRLSKAETARDEARRAAEMSPKAVPARFAEGMRTRTAAERAFREVAAQHPEHEALLTSLADDLAKNDAFTIGEHMDNPRQIISGELKEFEQGSGRRPLRGTKKTGAEYGKERLEQTGTDYSLKGQARREAARAAESARNEAARGIERDFATTPAKLGITGTPEEIAAQMKEAGYQRWSAEGAAAKRQGSANPYDVQQVAEEATYLPKHLFAHAENMLNRASSEMQFIEKYYDRAFMGRVKMWQLGLSPKWLVGNVFGNAMMAMVGGGVKPSDYYRGIQQARRLFAEQAPEGWQEGGRAERMWAGHKQRLFDQGEELRGRGLVIPEELKRGFNERETEFLRPDALEKVNPVRRLAAKGYAANEYTDNVSRAALYLAKLEPRRALLEQMDRGGPEAIVAARKLANTADGKQALAEALKAAGDFSKMTPFEREVVRRAVPFYAWYRHITRLTFGLPIYSPTRTVWMLHLGDVFGGGEGPRTVGAGTKSQEELPPFLQGAVHAGPGLEIGIGGMNPFNQGADSPVLSPEGAMSSLTPAIRWPVAMFLGKDMSKGLRDLTRPPGEVETDEYGRPKITPLFNPVDPTTYSQTATFLGKQFPAGRVLDKLAGDRGANFLRYDTGDPMLSHGQKIASSSPGGVKGAAMQLFGVPYAQDPGTDQFENTRDKREVALWRQRQRYHAQLAATQ